MHLPFILCIYQFGFKTESKANSRHKTCHLYRCPNKREVSSQLSKQKKREVHEGVYAETDIQNACQYPHYLACGDVSHSWHDQTAHALPYIIYLLKLHDADREVT